MQVARAAGLPLVVHVGETSPLDDPPAPFPIAEVLDLLAPGDILAHVCTPRPGGLLDSNGRVHPAAREAAERGVRFDVAHGRYNFSFAVARRLAEQGITPDIISTDISRGSRGGPVVDLPTTLSKFLALGFPLHQVVSMATRNVAGAFGLESTLGSVAVGRPADLSIVRLVEQPWDAVDSVGEVIRAPTMLEPLYAIRSGRPIGPLAREPA